MASRLGQCSGLVWGPSFVTLSLRAVFLAAVWLEGGGWPLWDQLRARALSCALRSRWKTTWTGA
eukprot:14242309-Alexandrium_andersonii.AAC.1